MLTREQRMEEIEKMVEGLSHTAEELRIAHEEMAAKYAETEKCQAVIDAKLDMIVAKLGIHNTFDINTDDESHGSKQSKDDKSSSLSSQKMEFPNFDGTDAQAWLAWAEQFFLIHKTSDANKVELAVIVLFGSAMSWYQLLIKKFAI